MSGRDLGVLAGAYFVGSISFSLLIVRLLSRIDLRTIGSGNAGATNVLRASGRWPALLALALDVAKGVAPVRIAQALGATAEVAAGAGLAAVLGHVFPVWFGFRGGKGVATGFGVFLALFPLAAALALGLFVGVVGATRIVSLGSIVAAVALPLLALGLARGGWAPAIPTGVALIATAAVAIVLARHRTNFARLLAGTERRLGSRRTA
ncbi:MAG: glycerol-3-phosphate acyltransferase [Acidobacteriota bacterium]